MTFEKLSYQFLIRNVSGTLLAVSNTKILAIYVNTVFTSFTTNGTLVLDAFPANIAKFPLKVTNICPTVRYWILMERNSIQVRGVCSPDREGSDGRSAITLFVKFN